MSLSYETLCGVWEDWKRQNDYLNTDPLTMKLMEQAFYVGAAAFRTIFCNKIAESGGDEEVVTELLKSLDQEIIDFRNSWKGL